MSKKYYNTRDSYVIYKNISENPVDIKKFIQIANSFMKFLSKKLFDRGTIIFPEKLGKLNIVGKKVKVRVENGEIKGLS